MASQQSTVDFIVEQMARAGVVRARKMFGEYAIYCDDKLIALVCDNQLFVKPTPGGRRHISDAVEAPPYKGAKPWLVIPGDRWEDAEWLSALAKVSAAELPKPLEKKPRPKTKVAL
jgi:TfoX/Sxy family transcriptional regulator of competence genes